MLQWLKSLFGREAVAEVHSEAKVAHAASDAVCKIVSSQFEMAGVSPFDIRKDAIEFTCGYIVGFSDVMAQASGAKGGQSLSMSICIRTMQRIYGNEAGETMFRATISAMDARAELFKRGMNAGGEDANHFFGKNPWIARLADYLMEKSTEQ